jgi:hypothetical protein
MTFTARVVHPPAAQRVGSQAAVGGTPVWPFVEDQRSHGRARSSTRRGNVGLVERQTGRPSKKSPAEAGQGILED